MRPDDFYPEYYARANEDVINSPDFGRTVGQVTRHYANWGIPEGRSPNPFFIPVYYLTQYPDVLQAAGPNNVYTFALRHWVNSGIYEGRRGSPIFDPLFYLSTYPDVANAFGPKNYLAAYQHWIINGISEDRRSIPEMPYSIINSRSRRMDPVTGSQVSKIVHPSIRVAVRVVIKFAKDFADWVGRILIAIDANRELKEEERRRYAEYLNSRSPEAIVIGRGGYRDVVPGPNPDRPWV